MPPRLPQNASSRPANNPKKKRKKKGQFIKNAIPNMKFSTKLIKCINEIKDRKQEPQLLRAAS